VFSTIAIGHSLYVITQTQKLSRERNEQLESALRSIIAWSQNGLDCEDFEKLAQMALKERSEDGTGAPPDREMYQDPLYIAHQEWISQILEIEPNTIPYTFVPTGNGQEILWIGDGFRMIEERMPDQTSFGESYDSSGSELYGGLSGVTVRLDGYSDAFGRWVSAYGPIFNSEGEVVGGIGIDLQLD
jgi:hypothetical protein